MSLLVDYMSSSFLTESLRSNSEALKAGAADRISDYEHRFQALEGLHQTLFGDLIIDDFSTRKAYNTALEFFGSEEVPFAGIDGTEYSKPLFDLMVFFGGAYASTGTIRFREDETPRIQHDLRHLDRRATVSSIVPIYINEVPDIDQAFFDEKDPGQITLSRPLVDQTIINNATIANWIMTLAEHHLAYSLAETGDFGLLLMDRTLSGEHGALWRATTRRRTWKARSALIGYEVDGEPIDLNTLAYGRSRLQNSDLGLPSPRAEYLQYAILHLLEHRSGLSMAEICDFFEIHDAKRKKRVEAYLRRAVREKFVERHGAEYSLKTKYTGAWDRLKKLVGEIGEQFFHEEGAEAGRRKLTVEKDGERHWLTTLDIAFLTLFTLYMTVEQCWKNNILFLGITKDTAARDFKRQLLPIAQTNNLITGRISGEVFERIPNTDRMILQTISLLNHDEVSVPWALVEYDSAFKTMIPDRRQRRMYVEGARNNWISMEKLWLKTYVQLTEAATDPMLRSNVLLTDRLVYPRFDLREDTMVDFTNVYKKASEPLSAILFNSRRRENQIQNLIMTLLPAMAPPSIPEAFGHNKPLFIADKVAKWHGKNFRRIIDTTRQWILNNHKLRDFVFYMSTFRERRASIEAVRTFDFE